MNTHTVVAVVTILLVALHGFAQDGSKQTQQGADASKDKTDNSPPTKNDESWQEYTKQRFKHRFQEDFFTAKETEKKLDKARKKLEELKKFKEFVTPEAIQQTQEEITAAEKEFDSAKFYVSDSGMPSETMPNDEAKTAIDDYKAVSNEANDAETQRMKYINKLVDDMRTARKTEDEIGAAMESDPKIKEMDEKHHRLQEALSRAARKLHDAYYEAIKKAEREGKLVLEEKSNDRFKANLTSNGNEPQGGLKLGGSSYVPSNTNATTGVQTPMTNWDFSGIGPGSNQFTPQIILPPYGGSGWGGPSRMFPFIPGDKPTIPGSFWLPQSSAHGCSCKPTCTCKPVCNCK